MTRAKRTLHARVPTKALEALLALAEASLAGLEPSNPNRARALRALATIRQALKLAQLRKGIFP